MSERISATGVGQKILTSQNTPAPTPPTSAPISGK
jgi:hypothetical protein